MFWNLHAVKTAVTCSVLALAAAGALQARALTVEPETLRFDRPDVTKPLALKGDDGEPVAADSVRSVGVFVGEHGYDHMFRVRKEDGRLLVTPTDEAEVGRYTLRVVTGAGTGEATLYTPFATMESIVEKRAKALGVSTEAARVRLGLFSTPPRREIALQTPAVLYEGQTLEMAAPETDAATQEWLLNGHVLKKGPGAERFSYTFERTGDYVLGYREKKGDEVIGRGAALVSVVPLPAMGYEVMAGQEFTLTAPEGFRTYAWSVNDVYVAGGRALTYQFDTPGAYRIECIARKNGTGFVRYRYHTVVTPQQD